MQTNQLIAQTKRLGDVITAAYEVSDEISPDRAVANELAARHLERVLVRGANLRLVAALRDLARELAAPGAQVVRSNVRDAGWAPPKLAVGR